MANVDPQQQILLRLAAITAADLALVGWIVRSAVQSGVSPDSQGFRRDDRPFAFWVSIALVIAVGIGFAAGLAYLVLEP